VARRNGLEREAFRRKTRAPTAFNAVGQGVLCRCGARDSLCQASLCTAYYQGAQCSRLCRTRAEPVCSIKWIRRHGTFPSCHLRRKLHRPLKLRGRRRQASVPTRHRLDMMSEGLQEQAKETRKEISFACDAIMYERCVIFILHRWAHLSGTQRPCTRPL